MSRSTAHQTLLITPQQLEFAYQWLIKQRNSFPVNADIWFFKRDWEANKERLFRQEAIPSPH